MEPAIVSLLEAKRNFESSGPATHAEVSQLESALGFELPQQYKLFLQRFGCVCWFGNSIYGIGEGPYPDFENLDVLIQTGRFASTDYPSFFKPFPKGVIVVNRYAGGGAYLLFCEAGDRLGQVGLREDDQHGKLVQWWPDFYSWVRWIH